MRHTIINPALAPLPSQPQPQPAGRTQQQQPQPNNAQALAFSMGGGDGQSAGKSAAARVLGSGSAGVLELALFHPVDTVAKRLMSYEVGRCQVGWMCVWDGCACAVIEVVLWCKR